ncbi:MAG TPA: nodulation protein NfeD [Actinomycetota bacterium]|nr:nodulation protein NfeD [Actinomycetota bacterium]
MIERSRIGRTALAAALVIAGLAAGADAQTRGPVVRLSLEGVVDPFVADYLSRGVADAQDAPAILLTIDTPGGLDSSMREIIRAIRTSSTPVLCYVSPQGARAASAGAFILMACHVAAMAPATNVGASTPVGIGGVTLSRKVEEDAAATIRSLAEERGRNAELAGTFVTESKSITAEEALAGDVIDLIEPTERALLEEVDGRGIVIADGTRATIRTAGVAIEERPMSPGAGFLHDLFDPNLAFIFFWLGLALIVLELIVPGHVFSGTVGTILLLTSIASFGLLPVRLIGIALLVASIVSFVLELKMPGLGVWSAAGIGALVLGGLFLFDPSGGVRVSPFVILPVAAFMALFFGYVVAKALAMRHLPPAQGPEAVVGREGVVLGRGLGPDGVVRVAAEEWKATSSAGPLPGGAKIRVTRIDGLVLTVEPLEVEHAPTGGVAPAEEMR